MKLFSDGPEKLGVKYATPIFDSANLGEISDQIKEAGLPELGKTYLYDGETGERFHQQATVGVIYMLKLNHMVDDKMHARSIGPYTSSPSSRWEVKRSSVVSVSVKWKYGRWKPTVLPTSCRNFLP